MPDLAEAESLDASRRDFWQVRPDPLSHTAFARTLTIPDSEDEHGRQDPYDPRSHPGQWHFLQAIDGFVNLEPTPRRYRRFLLLTDAQGGGKSWLLQQIALHGTIELGQPVIWALPTKGLAGDMWNTKLRPAWEGSGLGVYLPTSGPGSRGSSAPRSIRTRRHEKRGGGTLVFMSSGGRGQAGQAGLTAKRLIVDELGDWSKAAFTRIRKRVSRFNDISVEAYGSTLKLDSADLSLEVYQSSARVTVEYRCPHCGAWTALDWKTWKPTDTDGPSLACVVNGCVIRESDRRAMFAVSRAVIADPNNDIFGIRLTAMDCPWKSLAWLANEEAAARAAIETSGGMPNHEPMRTFYHDERVEIYTADQQVDEDGKETPHSHRTLATRSESTAWATIAENSDDDKRWSRYTAATIPPAVTLVAGSIDVQRNRLYCTAVGLDVDRRTYDLAWSIERARSGQDGKEPPPWSAGELQETLSRGADYLEEVAGPLFRAGVVDVSDGVTQGEVAEWLSTRPNWHAIQGEDHLPAVRPNGSIQARTPLVCWDTSWRNGMGSYRVVTALAQQAVAESYRIAPSSPGAGMLPGPLRAGNTYLRHLTAVGWVTTAAGRRTWAAIKGAGRFDYFDCRAYATAVVLSIRQQDTEPKPTTDLIDLPIQHLSGIRL